MERKKDIIKWVDVETKIVSIEEYNKILKNIKDLNIQEHKIQDIGRALDFAGTYQLKKCESYIEIRLFSPEGPIKYRVSFTGVKQSTVRAGKDGYDYINDMFESKYHTTMFKAFSGKKYENEYKDVKKCVITQVDYAFIGAINTITHDCFKSDVSSAYPYQLTKSLPTLHNCKRIKGRAEPTEEYPFAFYIKSHHVKIYNELYTKDFGKSSFYAPYINDTLKWRPNDKISADEDETILCKVAEYELKDIFEKIYSERKIKPELKTYMVACIGYFHKNTNPTLSPIAAVVLARCANDMLKRCNILTREGNLVLLVNTDSIIWQGKQSKISSREKYLGSFSIEYEHCDLALAGVKAYQIKKDDKVITRHSGLDKSISSKLKFGEIFDINAKQIDQVTYFMSDDGFIEEV